jgi:hypothetical protein
LIQKSFGMFFEVLACFLKFWHIRPFLNLLYFKLEKVNKKRCSPLECANTQKGLPGTDIPKQPGFTPLQLIELYISIGLT